MSRPKKKQRKAAMQGVQVKERVIDGVHIKEHFDKSYIDGRLTDLDFYDAVEFVKSEFKKQTADEVNGLVSPSILKKFEFFYYRSSFFTLTFIREAESSIEIKKDFHKILTELKKRGFKERAENLYEKDNEIITFNPPSARSIIGDIRIICKNRCAVLLGRRDTVK